MIGEGDKVAARFTFRGTFKGELMGMAPTGKKVEMSMAIFFRFVNGREVEAIEFTDSLTMYRQMGIKPPAG
jgi:predicted ester cyclase